MRTSWSIDFWNILGALGDDFGVLLASSIGVPAIKNSPKIDPFGVARGVRRQLCFPRVSEDQFGCVLSDFGKVPNSFFASLLKTSIKVSLISQMFRGNLHRDRKVSEVAKVELSKMWP